MKRVSKSLQRLERHVRFATFDLANMSAVQARAVREHILRPTAFLP
jgi:hypothetical protein